MKTEKTAFSMVSLGCARSLVDTEKMIESLQNHGFSLVTEGSGEKITLLNTCSFIQSAIDETEKNIQDLSLKKEAGEIRYLVVTGCYPSRFKKEDLLKKFPRVDLWLTTKEEEKIHTELSNLVFQKKFQPHTPKPYTKLTPSHFAYLKISEGCNNWCSFCTIPKIRGIHTSRTLEDIKTEAIRQISFGVKEFLLIAEDTTCWGEDIYGKPSFPLLLQELGKLPVKWIRPMYIFPARVDDTLIHTIATTPAVCQYLDMPIQHVNDEMLRLMKRGHTKARLTEILTQLRTAMPNLSLRTTLILGFPGETQAMFDELLNFIEIHPFDHIGCFAYSPESETRALKLPDAVSPDISRKRIHQLMETQKKRVALQNKTRIGETIEFLYEGNGVGRSYREAPDVDSRILVTNPQNMRAGEFYYVTLTGVKGYDLIAAQL